MGENIKLEKEINYYNKNKEELLKLYCGKYLVIKNEKVIASYDSQSDAFSETIKTEKIGTFLIHYCVEDDSVIRFHSRVGIK